MRGNRKPEWECSGPKCGKRTFVIDRDTRARTSQCRRCSKPLDMTKDGYIDETGKRTWWPTELLAPADHFSAGFAKRPPRHTVSPPPGKPLSAKEQLKRATESGLDEWILDELRGQIAADEEQARQQRPLGQRLDNARASLKKAVERAEKAEDAVEAAQRQLEEAAEDVNQWHAQVQAFTVEAACTGEMNDMAPIAETMELLARAVESTWLAQHPQGCGASAIPKSLNDALNATRECLAQLRGPPREEEQRREAVQVKQEADDDDGSVRMSDECTQKEPGVELKPEAPAQPPPPAAQQAEPVRRARSASLPPGSSAPAPRHQEEEEREPPQKAPRAQRHTAYNLPDAAATGTAPTMHTEMKEEARLRDILGRARRFIRPIAELETDQRRTSRSPRR